MHTSSKIIPTVIGPGLEKALLNEPVTICVQDGDLRYLWIHNQHPAWAGFNLVGLKDGDAGTQPDEFIKTFVAAKRAALERDEKVQMEEWMKAPDGNRYFFKFTFDPYILPDGSRGIIAKHYDLTKEKQVELRLEEAIAELNAKNFELEEAERRFRNSLEDEQVVIFIQDAEFRNVWSYNNMPSWGGIDLNGLTTIQAMPNPDVVEKVNAIKRRVLETRVPEHLDTWTTSPSGKSVYVRLGYYPYQFKDGTVGILGKSFDATAQKLTEEKLEALNAELTAKVEALKESEAKIQAALGDEILASVQDNNLRFVWVSMRQAGWDESALIGKTDEEALPDKEQGKMAMALKRRIIETGEPFFYSDWVTAPNGERRFQQGVIKPYPMPDGTIGVVGKIIDVTELKKTQEKVEELNRELESRVEAFLTVEKELRLALEGEPIILFIADSQLRYTWAYNLPKGLDVIGKTDLEVHPDPEAAKLTMDAKQKAIDTRTRQISEGWTTDKLGQTVYRRSIYDPYELKDGSIGVIGKHYNLTEAKRVEKELEEKVAALEVAERELGLALEGEPIILFIADSELRYTWAYNLPKGLNVIGKTDLEVHPDPEAARMTMDAKRKTIETGERQISEGWTTDKLGQTVYRKSIYDPYILKDGSLGVIGKHYNLTEAKRAEQALEEKVQALEAAEKELGLALEGEPIILFIADSELRYTWAYNLPKDLNVIGKTDLEVHPDPEAARLTMDAKRRTIETGQRQVSEGWTTDKLGQVVYRRSIYDPYRLKDGSLGVIGKHYNLTESKRIEQELEEKIHALQDQDQKFKAALEGEQMSLSIDDANLNRVWSFQNIKEWEGIVGMGHSQDEFRLRSLPKDASEAIKRRVLETGEVQRAEDWVSFPDGKNYYLKGTYYPYHFPDGSVGVISRIFNLTQNKIIEEQLASAKTELEQKVTQLEEAEHRFEVALDNEPISLYIQDEDLRYLWVHNLHPAWAGINLVGKTDRELGFAGSDLDDKAIRLKREVLATGERRDYDAWFKMPEGDLFLRTIFAPYPLPGGRKGVVGKTYDLTSMKQTERHVVELNEKLNHKIQEIEETQGKLNAALEGEPITLAIMDENLRYIWSHNTSPKFTHSQNMGTTSVSQTSEEDAQYLDTRKALARDTGQAQTFSRWLTTQTGHRAYMKLTYSPYPMPNGRMGVIGKAYDLTEFQLAQDKIIELNQELQVQISALEDAENKLAEALDGEPIVLFIQDKDLRYVWVYNLPGGEAIMGKTDIEVHPVREVAEEAMAAKQKAIDTLEPQILENWAVNKDLKRVFRKSIYKPYTFPDGSVGIIGKFYDLTEMKQAEEELKILNKALDKEKREVDAALKRLSEEHQRKLNDLAEASRLQHALLPKGVPMPAKLDFAAHMATCLEVGGDYYDFKEKGEHVLFALGDATGHGLQSGTIVAMVKSYFQLLALNQPVDALMETISQSLAELDLRKMFMGLLLLEYRPEGFLFTSAGMPPVFVHRAKTGRIDTYLQKRVFLGTGLATRSSSLEIPMEPGDLLVAMTDGIIESINPNGDMMSLESIHEMIQERSPKGAKSVVEGLFRLQRTWMDNKPLKDDTTVIAIGYR